MLKITIKRFISVEQLASVILKNKACLCGSHNVVAFYTFHRTKLLKKKTAIW